MTTLSMQDTNGEEPITSPLHDDHDIKIVVDQEGRNIINFEKLIKQVEAEEDLKSSAFSHLSGGGLPPPPRANNRIPKSPTRPTLHPPVISPDTFKGIPAGPSAWNPYNPSNTRQHRNSYSDPDIQQLCSHPATAPSSPAPSLSHSDSSHTTYDKSVASLPPSPQAPPPLSTPVTGFKRNHRYLASFSKIEKFLGKGRLNPLRRTETSQPTASISDLNTIPCSPRSPSFPEMQQMDSPTQLVSTTPPNGSPISESPSDQARVRSTVATTPGRDVTEASQGLSQLSRPHLPARQQIDSGRHLPSAMSTTTGRRSSEYASSRAFSESSHEPPSTPSEGRISISSTIYPGSSYAHSINDSHLYRQQSIVQGRPSMTGDRDSFIEMISPTSPRSPGFDHPHDHNASYSTNVASNSSARRPIQVHEVTKVKSHTSPPPTSKPPLPTSPKPNFRRSQSAQPPSRRPSPLELHQKSSRTRSDLPPTTNLLNAKERAGLVRKTQKITQVFGQNPGPLAFSQNAYEVNSSGTLLSPSGALGSHVVAKKHLHQRGAVSVSGDSLTSAGLSKEASWPPQEGTLYLSLGGRRHSTPLSPRDFSFTEETTSRDDYVLVNVAEERQSIEQHDIGSEEGAVQSKRDRQGGGQLSGKPGQHGDRPPKRAGSPTSFMDLSDEDIVHGGASSIITLETPKASRTYTPFSPSTPSLLSPEEQLEEDRRRKREKLAKLHRFLGSRVPQELVLAQIDTTLPRAPAGPISAINPPAMNPDMDARKTKVRRRRSSSAAEFPGTWSDDVDRLKEELNDREKAINVRRAVKMEKMFGVAPPQTLYHTRHTASQSQSNVLSTAVEPSSYKPSGVSQSPITSALRNLNNTSYMRGKAKKSHRPGTADSATPLVSSQTFDDVPIGHALSDVYLHYRHSLNSLNDIIDRDDKESLVDLHDYLHGGSSSPPLQTFTLQDGPSALTSPTIKAERRRSLPSRTSMTSLSSEFSVVSVSPTPTPDASGFQARRRRAAKLTQFFGVDYCELMGEILDSIEKGLEEESGKGTLQPEEVEDLLRKLRKLKVKRNTSFI